MDVIRSLGLGTAVAMGGGDANYKPPEPVPVIRQYTPPKQQHRRQADEDNSTDIYRKLKAERDAEREEMGIQRYARAAAFDRLSRRKFNLDFIDQTPSS